MNLVEATVADGAVEFAGFRIPLAPERRPVREGKVILGIRPESFEDAAFADPALPQIDVEVSVLEELGADAHVIFPIDAPRVAAEDLEAAADEPIEGLIADDQRALFNARVDPRTAQRRAARSGSPSIRGSSTSSIPRRERRSRSPGRHAGRRRPAVGASLASSRPARSTPARSLAASNATGPRRLERRPPGSPVGRASNAPDASRLPGRRVVAVLRRMLGDPGGACCTYRARRRSLLLRRPVDGGTEVARSFDQEALAA